MKKNHIFVMWVYAAFLMFLFIKPEMTLAKDKKIGVQLYSLMDAVKKNPETSIKRLAQMGYTRFELVQWGGDPKVFGLPADEFKAICNKYRAEIISTHSSLQEDPDKEDEIMERWRELFEIQKACGGKYFVIPSYQTEYTVEGIQRMCNYFNRVGKLASEYGLKLGYHNHSNEFTKLKNSDKIMWEYLVENTNPTCVCFELDVYWCTKGGKDPVAY